MFHNHSFSSLKKKSNDIHAFTLLIQEFNKIITFPKIYTAITYRVKCSYSKAWRTFIKIQFSKHRKIIPQSDLRVEQ